MDDEGTKRIEQFVSFAEFVRAQNWKNQNRIRENRRQYTEVCNWSLSTIETLLHRPLPRRGHRRRSRKRKEEDEDDDDDEE